jgi:hypothetical protein
MINAIALGAHHDVAAFEALTAQLGLEGLVFAPLSARAGPPDFGPDLVRIGLWSHAAAEAGLAGNLALAFAPAPHRSILVALDDAPLDSHLAELDVINAGREQVLDAVGLKSLISAALVRGKVGPRLSMPISGLTVRARVQAPAKERTTPEVIGVPGMGRVRPTFTPEPEARLGLEGRAKAFLAGLVWAWLCVGALVAAAIGYGVWSARMLDERAAAAAAAPVSGPEARAATRSGD